jgi:hypothetical protein
MVTRHYLSAKGGRTASRGSGDINIDGLRLHGEVPIFSKQRRIEDPHPAGNVLGTGAGASEYFRK